MLNTQIIEYNNEKFILKRTLNESSLIPNYSSDDIKECYFVDTVLKKGGILYLCNKIEDAQIV
jgi:hypothetical protein